MKETVKVLGLPKNAEPVTTPALIVGIPDTQLALTALLDEMDLEANDADVANIDADAQLDET